MAGNTEDTTERPRGAVDRRGTILSGLRTAGAAFRLLCLIVAALLAVHAVLTVAGTNPGNGLVRFVSDAAINLTLGLDDLFLLESPALQVVLNNGAAAVLWLVIGAIVVKVVGAAAG